MTKTFNIPFGSQHVALAEPVRFEFTTENETIVDVRADVGYVHRGVEKACTTTHKFKQVGYVVARVCGLCAITHSTAYTQGVEELLNLEVSKRVKYLRMLLLELDRIHSHMFCLSHTAETAGFEALFMKTMKHRESVMQIQELLTGSRVQFDYVCIGGVNRDIAAEHVTAMGPLLDRLERDIRELAERFTGNWSLSLAYKGVGSITEEDAYRYNVVGPLARAAGAKIDVRAQSDLLPYAEIGFEVITEEGGDIHGRNMVRLREVDQSIKMIRNILDNLPEGEIQEKVKGMPEGDVISRVEAPRGELAYVIRGAKSQFLDRMRIKTPTYSGLPAMIEMFKGEQYASAPAILASFDPCMSCTAK